MHFSKIFLSPPHIKVRAACSAPTVPPETGASSMSNPACLASECASSELSTSIVEQSINIVLLAALLKKSGEVKISFTSFPVGSMVMTKSTSFTKSQRDAADMAP